VRNCFLRHLDELHKGRAEQRKAGEPAYRGGYYRPSPDWFQAPGVDLAEAGEEEPEAGEEPEARGEEPEAPGVDRVERGGLTETSRGEIDGDGPWDSDCEDEALEGLDREEEEEAERVMEGPPVPVVQERPRLEPGYTNKVMTGSKRERRRLRKLEREQAAKGRRRRAARVAS